MTRVTHTLEEKEVFELWAQMARSYYNKYNLDMEHVDKPDFILSHKRNKKRVGVEIVGLHNSDITKSNNSYNKIGSKAHQALLEAMIKEQAHTKYSVKTSPTAEFFGAIISKKLELVASYKKNGLDSVILIIHNCVFFNIKTLNDLHNNLISFLEQNNCEYDKVYLIDFFEHKGKFLSKVFERGQKIKPKVIDQSIRSESRSSLFVPVDKEVNILKVYK